MAPQTICDIFYRSVDTFRKPEHLKFKRDGAWRAVSSEELRAAVEEASMGLRALGVGKGDTVAILSENRPEWAIADLATLCAGAADATIYAALTPPQVQYILNDSESKVAFVSTAVQAAKVAEVRDKLPHLRHVIRFEIPAPVPGTLSLDELRAKGREALAADRDAVRRRAGEITKDDLATLIYTSGTTGDPKGVMLVHSNIVSNVDAARQVFDVFGPEDVALSFLPLCHIFERMAGYYMMVAVGATIAIGVADTIGVGTPEKTKQAMDAALKVYELADVSGHFHDTYGMATANVYACLELGIAAIDTSIAGLGGCPYAKGATGNVATEDVLYLLNGLGIDTGIDFSRVVETGQCISGILQRKALSRAGNAVTARQMS